VTETSWEPFPPVVGQIESAVLPGHTFAVRLPANLTPQFETVAGRYFLLRCSSAAGSEREADWSIFLRQPLFVCGRQALDRQERWLFYLPHNGSVEGRQPERGQAEGHSAADAGRAWLARRTPGDILNLLGPFGNGFTLFPEQQNLLILVDTEDDRAWFWKLLPLCEEALDGGGRVTVLIRAKGEEGIADLIPSLPVQVEVRSATSKSQWLKEVGSAMGWADQVCGGVSPSSYGELLSTIRQSRFRVDRSFAQILVRADLLCGVGACLVCAIPTVRGGVTRSCVHGPVFDLTDLAE